MTMVCSKTINKLHQSKLVLISVIILLTTNLSLAENSFYNDRERGWYFHESFEADKAKKEQKPLPVRKTLREMDADQVLETLENVQKEMQVRQARYTLEPTLENARDFLDYQRLMFKNGSQAGEAMKTALIKYPYLDSRLENPIHSQAIKINTLEANAANDIKIKEFAQHFKLLYFFKADCRYCQEFKPVLEQLIKTYGFEVEAISGDGKKLESSAPIVTRIDNGLATKLQVTTYPTIIAYNHQNNIYLPVSRGFLPTEDLKLNILHVYSHIVKLSLEVK